MQFLLRTMVMIGLVLSPVSTLASDSKTILAYGDSLIAGYGLEDGQDFASQLEKALREKGHNVKVINSGVSGETTAGGLARLDWTLSGMKTNPDLVILALGANDMLRGLSPQRAKDNLEKMIMVFKSREIPVLLAGMKASPNLGPDYTKNFNSIYEDLAARQENVSLYPFLLEGVATRPEFNQSDGLHPNAKGVEEIVGRMKDDVLTSLLNAQATGQETNNNEN